MIDFDLILATGNPDKKAELVDALAHLVLPIIEPPYSLAPEETGDTLFDNALLKARAYAETFGIAALADASGLEVDALRGGPGVYSARYGGTPPAGMTQYQHNNAKILAALARSEQRTARFRCVIAVVAKGADLERLTENEARLPEGVRLVSLDDGWVVLAAEGTTEGVLLREAKGVAGFGYDPLFLSDELGVTFAEASKEAKRAVSHRGKALRRLIQALEFANLETA